MIPKKANSLYKEITKEFDVSEDLVENLVELYYKTLRKNLSDLSELRINADGLGHFVIKIQKVKKNYTTCNNQRLVLFKNTLYYLEYQL